MKQQCETAADCLRELARVMDQFGIKYPLDAINSGYIRYKLSDRYWQAFPDFSEPAYWEFAIAEVDGKPVFIGDKLYDWKGDAHTVPYLNDWTKMDLSKGCEWTWTPPKPKIILIALPQNTAFVYMDSANIPPQHTQAVREACKKALEELK